MIGESKLRFLDDISLGDGASHHDLIHEIYNSRGRLLWFQFGKYVALIVRFVSRFSCHKTEAATREKNDK